MLKMGSPDEGLYARLLSHRGSAGAGQTDMQLTFTPREATPMAQLLPRACPAALDLIGQTHVRVVVCAKRALHAVSSWI